MPDRIIREGVCTSDPIESLQPGEEVCFYRLMTQVDDFGRFDGRASIVKANCFPLKETLTLKQVELWLSALARAGLILRYIVAGKPYLLINKFGQRLRAMRSKYPEPDGTVTPEAANTPTDDVQPHADVSTSPQFAASCAGAEVKRSETETETKRSETKRTREQVALPDWLDPEDWERWRKYRGAKLKPEVARLHLKRLAEFRGQGHDPRMLIDLAIEGQWVRFWTPRERDPPKGHKASTLAERRTATLDEITRTNGNRNDIAGTAERMDSTSLRSLPEPVREQGGDDVGSGGPERLAAGVGRGIVVI